MIILRKKYASEAGVSGIKNVENPLISFLNLEKFNGTQSQICKVVVNDQEASDPTEILNVKFNIKYNTKFLKILF